MKGLTKLLLTIFFSPIFLLSNPINPQLISGDAKVVSQDKECIIYQKSDKAVMHWDKFSIGEDEVTTFIQPSASSAILNRVIGKDISEIYGLLKSNGQIYLINPNGFLIGPKGSLYIGGAILSNLDLSDQEFLSGSVWHFSGTSNGKICNFGIIKAEKNNVILLAKEIENNGSILAPQGKVDLIAGYDAMLIPSDNNKVSVGVKKEGQITHSEVISCIEAELKASGGNIYSLAINHEGLIEAMGLEYKDGKVMLISDAESINLLSNGAVTLNAELNGISKNVAFRDSPSPRPRPPHPHYPPYPPPTIISTPMESTGATISTSEVLQTYAPYYPGLVLSSEMIINLPLTNKITYNAEFSKSSFQKPTKSQSLSIKNQKNVEKKENNIENSDKQKNGDPLRLLNQKNAEKKESNIENSDKQKNGDPLRLLNQKNAEKKESNIENSDKQKNSDPLRLLLIKKQP